jgi:hypothetical protein
MSHKTAAASIPLALWLVAGSFAAAGVAAVPAAGQPTGDGVSAARLGNGFLAASISERGALTRLENLLSGEIYRITADRFGIATDGGVFRSDRAVPLRRASGPARAAFTFSAGDGFDVTLEYTLAATHEYIERRLRLQAKRPLTLLNLELGRTTFAIPPTEFVKYDTFWESPTVAFLRWSKGGLYAGIENPFFNAVLRGGEAVFSFEPSLLLKAGESYESEPQFLGVYKHGGRRITDWWPRTVASSRQGGINRPRFRNPCGHVPLDTNEIQAMRRFAADYLDLRVDRFLSILYMYWYPIEQFLPTPQIEAKYRRMIDQFHALGGDMIIFNPLRNWDRPGPGKDSLWDLAPPGTATRRVLDYADRAGIGIGFYMGVAHTGERGNACGLPFCPQHKQWKKTDPLGGTSGENCMACDEFADWWYAVQRNTIAKYHLRLWSWDPGPGNGFFCYSDRHGHIPGKGGYKGWRNATQLMGKLKGEFPQLYLMAFYGRKEYGLWGFKYFDQHEAYWEQTILYGATVHPDLHDDRVNADGARFQSWWNENFRFMPAAMNHALTYRIGENGYDPRLPKVWDRLGWKYSLMSGIASSGSVTACILPEDVDLVPGMREFYAKWLGWARQNFSYVRHNITFGDQVRTGGIDGHARIVGDHGFIFLCNPAPRPTRTSFALDESIGLSVPGNFVLKELYPRDAGLWFDHVHERGIFAAGDEVAVEVPAYEVMLLELLPLGRQQGPLVFGIGGRVRQAGETLAIDGASGERGADAEVVIEAAAEKRPRALVVNGQAIPLAAEAGRPRADVHFAGPKLPRMLDDWHTADGGRFRFPWHPAAAHLELSTTFHADPVIRTILKAAEPANLAEIVPLLEEWEAWRDVETARSNNTTFRVVPVPHNFAWARPDRLWLVLPFADADRVREVHLRCNGKEVPVLCFSVSRARIIYYSDMTDRLRWGEDNTLSLRLYRLGENQFLGPYFDYPAAELTTQVTAAGPRSGSPVVFDRPVDPEMPGREGAKAGPSGPAPRVLHAAIDPPFLGGPREITLTATVDMPPEQLRGVYVSAGWLGSFWPMGYDARSKTWRTVSYAPRRFPILDGDKAVFWAIGKDGQFGPSSTVPVKWLLGGFSAERFEASKHSPWPHVRADAAEAIRSLDPPPKGP